MANHHVCIACFSNYQLISPSFDLADVQTFNSGLPRCCLESGWSMTEAEIGFECALAKRGLNHLSIIRALALFKFWFGIVLLILFSIAFSVKMWMKNVTCCISKQRMLPLPNHQSLQLPPEEHADEIQDGNSQDAGPR